jgi:hypothetical protein
MHRGLVDHLGARDRWRSSSAARSSDRGRSSARWRRPRPRRRAARRSGRSGPAGSLNSQVVGSTCTGSSTARPRPRLPSASRVISVSKMLSLTCLLRTVVGRVRVERRGLRAQHDGDLVCRRHDWRKPDRSGKSQRCQSVEHVLSPRLMTASGLILPRPQDRAPRVALAHDTGPSWPAHASGQQCAHAIPHADAAEHPCPEHECRFSGRLCTNGPILA